MIKIAATEFVDAARRYVNRAKFQHAQRAPDAMDCAGLVVRAGRDCGVEIEDKVDYHTDPDPVVLEQYLAKNCERVSGEPQAGDILQMSWPMREHCAQHLAIFDSVAGTIIHAWAGRRRVCELTYTDSWRARVKKVWRYRWLQSRSA